MNKAATISVRSMLTLALALGGTGAAAAAESGDDTQGENIVTVLRSQGNLNQTADAIEQAGLSETLEGQGPFTVFAPTDEAWQQLPEDEREQLMSDAGLSRLRSILSYHVVPDEIRAADIQQMGSITTIQGQPLEVSRDGDRITVNGATVVLPGMTAGNGVVHGTDEILMPQQ